MRADPTTANFSVVPRQNPDPKRASSSLKGRISWESTPAPPDASLDGQGISAPNVTGRYRNTDIGLKCDHGSFGNGGDPDWPTLRAVQVNTIECASRDTASHRY